PEHVHAAHRLPTPAALPALAADLPRGAATAGGDRAEALGALSCQSPGERLMGPVVRVEHLVKHFPIAGSRQVIQAVNDVSFNINAGETLGIVGESGSGKTTVGRCVLRLIEPTSGRIVFEDRDLTSISESSLRVLRPRLQLVFQE